jgi:hypothetical protein
MIVGETGDAPDKLNFCWRHNKKYFLRKKNRVSHAPSGLFPSGGVVYYNLLQFPVSPSVYLFIALVALRENGLPCPMVGDSQPAWV